MSSTASTPIFWVGLDVHKDSITAAVFQDRDPQPLRVDRLPNDHGKLRRWFQRLQHDGHVRACYEASGAGYVLQIQREIVKSRHYILKFMRRRGFIYRDGTHWTTRHLNWIRQVLFPGTLADEDRMVLTEYLALLEYKLQRRDELDRRIEELALLPRFRPVVECLGCFRGFKTQAAMVIATELGDVRRFQSPRQLMAYVGLVPGERSSGERRRLGSITKAGNARVRHVLVQAAWHYGKRPAISASLRKRQVGQDAQIIQHAWKCQHRLYKVFHRLALKKPNQVAATAVARELVGFLWAALRDVDLHHHNAERMNQVA